MRGAVLLLLGIFAIAEARAESWKTTKSVCAAGFHPTVSPTVNAPPNSAAPEGRFHTLEECAIDFFTLDPVGPTAGNIGTGSGFGGGLHAVHQWDANHILTLKGLYSTNSSYVSSAQYRVVLPPLRPIVIGGRNGHPGQTDDTRSRLDLSVTRFDLRTQDFYGLGPSSTLAGHAVYRQIETWTGADGYMPLPGVSSSAGIVGVLGDAKYLRPETEGVSGSAFPSVNRAYGNTGAPASTSQPDFWEAGVGLSLHTPTSRPVVWEQHEGEILYHHYFDRGSSQYSFDRLDGWGDISFKLLAKEQAGAHGLANDQVRPWWKNAVCLPNPRTGCEIGVIKFSGRVTTSYTSAGSGVPFYLQPTLGGADFDGVDTLRGLVDYRLRAPNRLLFQVDFDKPIASLYAKGHPIGQYGLYTFFDAGNVSLTPGSLTAHGLRKDVGIGVSVAVQNKIILRAYIAFGAGEGSHPNAKMANAF